MDNMYFTSSNRPTGALVEPQFRRTRHRYRGPRESEKFNLDAGTFYEDVKDLAANIGSIGDILNVSSHLVFGTEESGDFLEEFLAHLESITTHWTPTTENGTLDEDVVSIAALRDRISALAARVKDLENG